MGQQLSADGHFARRNLSPNILLDLLVQVGSSARIYAQMSSRSSAENRAKT